VTATEVPAEGLELPEVPPEPLASITVLGRFEKQLARYPLARLTTTLPRTTRWALDALFNEADRIPGAPQARVSGSLLAQVAMDEAIIALLQGPGRAPRRADYERVAAELVDARGLFTERGWVDDPRSYHQDPPELADAARTRGWALGERYDRLRWVSGFEPRTEEPGSQRWQSFEANRTASAWIMEHPGAPRPWVIAVHGFGTGATFADLITFRAPHLFHDLGWNVAAITLPVHGHRRPSKFGGEEFLGIDMMNTVHALAQSVWDIRRLISWVRRRDPVALAMYGVSLGGYVTALTSCFVDDLDAVIAGIPVSDLAGLFGHQSPAHIRRRAVEHRILDGNAEVVHSVVSPLAMEPVAATDRRFIYAGLGDRMAVPTQAHALWEHWGRPMISWFPGNHVGYLWSAKVAAFVDDVLVGVHPVPGPVPR